MSSVKTDTLFQRGCEECRLFTIKREQAKYDLPDFYLNQLHFYSWIRLTELMGEIIKLLMFFSMRAIKEWTQRNIAIIVC